MLWTNRGKFLMLGWMFRAEPLPTNFYIALVTSDDIPTEDTNTFSELTEIVDGNGYDEGGYELTPGSPDFDTLTEDDFFDRAVVQIKDITWAAEGGAIPPSGNGARYVVLLEGTGGSGEVIGDRQVIAVWDMTTDKVITDEFALRLRNLELRMIGLGVGSEAGVGAGDDVLTEDEVPVLQVDYNNNDLGGLWGSWVYNNDTQVILVAQVFQATGTYLLRKLKLKLDHTSAGYPDSMTVSIRATSAGVPTGPNLVTSAPVSTASVPEDPSSDWIEFDLGADYNIVMGTSYAIVLEVSDTGAEWEWAIGWRTSNNGYDGGDYFQKTDENPWYNSSGSGFYCLFENWGY